VIAFPALPAENLRLDRPLLLSRVSRFAPINANCAPLTAQTARRLAPTGRAFAFMDIKWEFVKRFKDELGYKSALAWPIFQREGSELIVYFMIHATDHSEAPKPTEGKTGNILRHGVFVLGRIARGQKERGVIQAVWFFTFGSPTRAS
jgi:hypothetical protein